MIANQALHRSAPIVAPGELSRWAALTLLTVVFVNRFIHYISEPT
jgi:hypothetical protein